MSKLELHTSIEEIIPCEDIPSITVKKINLGKNYYWTPLRSIYLSTELPKDVRNEILKLKTKENLFEINRIIYQEKQYHSIKDAISKNDDEKMRTILRINQSIENEKISISFSFSDFPNKEKLLGKNNFEELLDIIHEVSSILFVPHVRYSKSTKSASEYNAKSFCKYIDSAVKILKEKNTKPIFIPFDIDYPQEVRNEILMHYAKNGYTNIWIDLKGKAFNRVLLGRIRTLWRVSSNLFGKNAKNLVFYLTNPRKTPRRNIDEIKISPSDVLGVFTYSDFIGVPFKGIMGYTENNDIWTRKGFSNKEEYERMLLRRESSIFDTSSYYYLFPEKLKRLNKPLEKMRKLIIERILSGERIAEKISYSLNGFITSNEITQIKEKVQKEGNISEYIEEKEFFKKEGKSLLEKLKKPEKSKKRREKNLFGFIELK